MFIVYILQSTKTGKRYIGHTEDILRRLNDHNTGRVKSTCYGKPWRVIYTEEYPDRSSACRREKEIKLYKGGIKLKRLLGLWQE